jgi:eukaryotic-like serine/threonine-protein kinase
MAKNHEDSNLLLGVLAIQMGFLSRDDLIIAMSEWAIDRSRTLGKILVERKVLTGEQHQLLIALVNARLAPAVVGSEADRSTDRPSELSQDRMATDGRPGPDRTPTAAYDSDLANRETSGEPSHDGTVTWVGKAFADAARRFRVLRPHARGGIGKVSVAIDLELNREVALKELLPARADDPQSRARFLLEAEITGRLEHPGIVPVYALGADEAGRPYYAMRFVRGETLRDGVARFHQAEAKGNGDPADRALKLRGLIGRLVVVANSVAYAHSRGIVHRDLKPSNILLGPYGETLMVDWGLAKFIGRDEVEGSDASSEETLRPSSSSGSGETVAGSAVGTPAFMSPEQAEGRGDRVGPLSDVYGLGATLYFVLTNQAPVHARDTAETLRRVSAGIFPRPRDVNPRADRALEAVCLKAMALMPTERYPSPRELAADFEQWLADEPVSAFREGLPARLARWARRNRAWAQAGAASLLVVALLAVVSAVAIQVSRNRVRLLLRESEIRSSELAFDRALALSGEGRVPEGILWFNRVLELAPRDVPEHRRVVLTNLQRWGAELRPLRERLGHKNRVVAVAFHPGDGRRVVTASHDGTARIWDAETGRPVGAPMVHADFVLAAAYHPNGRFVATASRDKTARLWDAETGTPVGATMTHDNWVKTLAFSPDGTRIATGSRDNTARLWDAETGAPLSPAMNHQAEIDRVIFSPDSRWVLTLGRAIARLWDAKTGLETGKTFQDPTFILDAAFRPDGKVLATGGADKTGRLWSVETGEAIGPALIHGNNVSVLAFSPDGQWLASGGWDRSVHLWDAGTGKLRWTGAGHRLIISALAFSPDGRTLASSSHDGTARLWNAADGWPLGQPLGHGDALLTLAFSPDGRTLATAGLDGSARLWDTSRVAEDGVTVHHEMAIENVVFSPDGQTLATAGDDKTARLWNARTGSAVCPPLRHDGLVHLIAFLPDGRRIATGSYDHTVRVWDVPTGSPVGKPMQHGDEVYALAISPDGRTLATGGRDKTARLWNAETGEPLGQPIPHPAAVKDAAFRPDGKAFATSCDDKKARLWSFPSCALIGQPMTHEAGVYAVAFDPTGKRLATGGDDKTARIWDAVTAMPLTPPLEHLGKIRSIAFSPDGRILATASLDTTARLWNALTGEPIGPPLAHQEYVFKVAFSPDGRTLATASQDRAARLWDVTTARPLGPPFKERVPVVSVAFSPDGRTLVAACLNGAARLIHPAGPKEDEPERLARWASVLTEMELGPGNTPRRLGIEAWRAQRRSLNDLGGPPR